MGHVNIHLFEQFHFTLCQPKLLLFLLTHTLFYPLNNQPKYALQYLL